MTLRLQTWPHERRAVKEPSKKPGGFFAKYVNSFGEEASFARLVVDEWREAHKEVFLEAPEPLKDISYSIDSWAVVVGRLKRTDTIVGKLGVLV